PRALRATRTWWLLPVSLVVDEVDPTHRVSARFRVTGPQVGRGRLFVVADLRSSLWFGGGRSRGHLATLSLGSGSIPAARVRRRGPHRPGPWIRPGLG